MSEPESPKPADLIAAVLEELRGVDPPEEKIVVYPWMTRIVTVTTVDKNQKSKTHPHANAALVLARICYRLEARNGKCQGQFRKGHWSTLYFVADLAKECGLPEKSTRNALTHLRKLDLIGAAADEFRNRKCLRIWLNGGTVANRVVECYGLHQQ
jgi:hypothetical protein